MSVVQGDLAQMDFLFMAWWVPGEPCVPGEVGETDPGKAAAILASGDK